MNVVSCERLNVVYRYGNKVRLQDILGQQCSSYMFIPEYESVSTNIRI